MLIGTKRPTEPAILFLLGNELMENGRVEAAIDAFQDCITAAPRRSAAYFNLGNAQVRAGRPMDAVDSFLACLKLAPDLAAAYVNLANTLRQLALLEAAQSMAEFGVHFLPGVPDAQICLANVLHDRCDYVAAEALYRQALAADPGHAGALASLGNTLHAMGRLEEALALHDQAIEAAPADPDFRFNRAMTLLTMGDFARGWDDYEWRLRRAQHNPRTLGPAWEGEDLAGRTILLYGEQGLGDTLQFVRYAGLVAAKGGRVVLEVQPPLVRLMRTLPSIAQVVARGDPLPAFDISCPLLSLPRAFFTLVETVPAEAYLQADAATWDARLPADGLRVGLVWAGSPHADDAGAALIDQRRSLPLAELAPLAAVPGVHFISLQKQRSPEPTPPELRLIDPMTETTDFCHTAAIIAALDLVISVDTSVAHLAGALGKPVWLLSRYNGCWRWMYGRDDSPWYPTMRLFRQGRPHDWSATVARLVAELASYTDSRASAASSHSVSATSVSRAMAASRV